MEDDVSRKMLEGIAASVAILASGSQKSDEQRNQMQLTLARLEGGQLAQQAVVAGLLKVVDGNGDPGLKSKVANLTYRLGTLETQETKQQGAISDYTKMFITALVATALSSIATWLMFKMTSGH